jgi:hypothetical protein
MNADRIFTVEEVNALIPTLSDLVGLLLLQQSEIEQCLAELARLQGSVPRSLEPKTTDSTEVVRIKADLRRKVTSYAAGWRRVQELGAVVKDPQIGLLDFYGRLDGRLVWLCWRYGEDTIHSYHDFQVGFAARRQTGPKAPQHSFN